MPKPDHAQGHGGGSRGKSEEAHARRDERMASRVYDFAGDDEGREAGQVNIVAKGHQGYVTVARVGGGETFLVKRDLLTPVGGDDDEAGEA